MAAYLLTWNPKRWHWDEEDYQDTVRRTRRGELVPSRWSCGNTTRIVPGDRLFLVRQSTERGIIGAGYATSAVFSDAHWDESRQNEQALFLKWQQEVLLPTANRLPIEELRAAGLDIPWDNLVASGFQVRPEERLDELWTAHLIRIGWQSQRRFTLPDEVSSPSLYPEGATLTITVNQYERNGRAREACIEYYGPRCVVCGFDFAEVYGEIGEGYIHVHHLKDLADIGEEHEVDPKADMRPVCPNCHAMLHTGRPAMEIDELRAIMRRRRT